MWIENFNSIFEPLSQSDTAISPDTLYTELLHEIASYHPSDDITMISKAYQIANTAHSGQFRKSGEPFIIHPLCVAIILSKLKMDKETIEAALLHDVVEDTNVSNEEIQNIFGNDVAHLVAGVTKLSQLPINLDIEEVQAANLRKMFLAMAKDIRVIIIKLADRLHNLRTLQFQPPNKQKKIAKETIEIYAPLALKLGISKIKVELDDLSLQYLHPNIYDALFQRLPGLLTIANNFSHKALPPNNQFMFDVGHNQRTLHGFLCEILVSKRVGAPLQNLLHNRKNIVLTDDGDLLTVHLDLGAGVLAGDNLGSHLHGHNNFFAVYHAARADCNHFGHLGLLLGGAGEDNATLGGLLRLHQFYNDAVSQGFEFHNRFLLISCNVFGTTNPSFST